MSAPHGEPARSGVTAASVAKGAATGGVAGAATAVIKGSVATSAGRRRLVRFLIAAVVVLVSLAMAVQSAIQAAETAFVGLQQAVGHAAVQAVRSALGDGHDAAIQAMQDAAGQTGIPWEILVSIYNTQHASGGDSDPFQLDPTKVTVKDIGAPLSDVQAVSVWLGDKLHRAMQDAGGDPGTDLGVGAEVHPDGTVQWVNMDLHTRQIVTPWTKALSTLPLLGASPSWAAPIVTTAVNWHLGVTSTGCNSVDPINGTAGSVAYGDVNSLLASLGKTKKLAVDGAKGLHPNALLVIEGVAKLFPQIRGIGGVRPDPYPDHPSGHATDIMLPGNYKTVADQALGQQIAFYFQTHYQEYGIQYIIWHQHIWNKSRLNEGWRIMPDRHGDTANHFDHVHVTVDFSDPTPKPIIAVPQYRKDDGGFGPWGPADPHTFPHAAPGKDPNAGQITPYASGFPAGTTIAGSPTTTSSATPAAGSSSAIDSAVAAASGVVAGGASAVAALADAPDTTTSSASGTAKDPKNTATDPNPETAAASPVTVTSSTGKKMRLTAAQMQNIARVLKVISDNKAKFDNPDKAMIIAVITMAQESSFMNLANSTIPGSMKIPHEGEGHDHDSVGLFQQRALSGAWGTYQQIMTPEYSAQMFLGLNPSGAPAGHARGLLQIPNWSELPYGAAAQKVQVSAFPHAYDQWVPYAPAIIQEAAHVTISASDQAEASSQCPAVGDDPASTTTPLVNGAIDIHDTYLPWWQKYGGFPGLDNHTADPLEFYWGECVSYAAWMVKTVDPGWSDFQNNTVINGKSVHFGNAKEWDEAANKVGIRVDTTPAVGAVAQTSGGTVGGHVAFVIAVYSDHHIKIAEYNFHRRHTFDIRDIPDWRTCSDPFQKFIHFEDGKPGTSSYHPGKGLAGATSASASPSASPSSK